MKIRALKKIAMKACMILTEDIYKLLPNLDYSSIANRYRAEDALKRAVAERYRMEPQVKEWSYQYHITYMQEYSGQTSLHVIVDPVWERENLLYLDFDK